MPIIKSAKKALKRSEVLWERNTLFRNWVKNAVKLLKKAVAAKDQKKADELLVNTYSLIDKSAKLNIFHKNNAARKKSQAAKLVATIKA